MRARGHYSVHTKKSCRSGRLFFCLSPRKQGYVLIMGLQWWMLKRKRVRPPCTMVTVRDAGI